MLVTSRDEGGADSGAGSRHFSGVGPIDGDEEECNWSDIDIDVVGGDKDMVGGKKKTKKDGSGINEIGGIGVGMARKKLDERMFSCGEPECEYFSKWAHVVKRHKAKFP